MYKYKMESAKTTVIEASAATATAEATASPLSEATCGIYSKVSSESIKLLELVEYCTEAEAKVKEHKTKCRTLSAAKGESLKIRDELIARNKTNATNWESWVQTKYEFEKIKCDLKAEYIMADEAAKTKKLRYQKTVSSYKSQWESTQAAYKKIGEVVDIENAVQQNDKLQKEISRAGNLLQQTLTEHQFHFNNYDKMVKKKLVQLSQEIIQGTGFNQYEIKRREKEMKLRELEAELEKLSGQTLREHKPLFFFKALIPPVFDRNDSNESNFSSAVDITAFDNISIPAENLETHEEEEEDVYFKNPKGFNSEMESNFMSDATSEYSSDEIGAPSKETSSAAQKSRYFQSSNYLSRLSQSVNEDSNAPEDYVASGQSSQYWNRKETTGEQDESNLKGDDGDEPDVNLENQSYGPTEAQKIPEKGKETTDERMEIANENDFENESNNEVQDEEMRDDSLMFDYEGSGDGYSKSPSFSEKQPLQADENNKEFPPAENFNPTEPSLEPRKSPEVNKVQDGSWTQPFSFTFNSNATNAGSSIFNLF